MTAQKPRRFVYYDEEGNIAIATESWVDAAQLPGYRLVEVHDTVTDETHWISPAGQPIAYTDQQREAKAKSPPFPARWSNTEMRWIDLRSLEQVKADCWAAIKAQRDAAEWGGFDTPFGRFDSDPRSQAKIIGAAQLASIAAARGEPFSIRWTLQDNSTVVLDAPAMIAVGVAMGQHIDSVHQIGRAKRAAIEAATTYDAVMAVTWSEGS